MTDKPMLHRRPYRVESVNAKGNRGLSIQVVDKYGTVVLGGFGYFYEDTLRTFVAALNGVRVAALEVQLRKLPLSDWAAAHDEHGKERP